MKVRRSELEATDRPLQLAYADPPYLGLARRYYSDQSSFAGEVDHAELLSRLASYDGWALSCSSRSVPAIAALCVAQDLQPRLAVWVRRPAPHATAGLITAWEGLFYVSARPVARGSAPLTDVLVGVEGRPRPTLPGSVIGMKPPAFCVWMFQLLGATPGDELADLFPGSGMVGRAWAQWNGLPSRPTSDDPSLWDPSRPPASATARSTRDASDAAAADATARARGDASRIAAAGE